MNIKPDIEIIEQCIPKAQMAANLEVSLVSIETFRKQGMPFVAKRGYPLIACLKWYISRLRKNEDRPSTVNLKHEKLQTEIDLLKIELAIAQGAVIALDDVRRQISESGNIIKTTLLGLPGRLAAEIAVEIDPAVIRDILIQEIKNTLNDASGKLKEFVDSAIGGGPQRRATQDADTVGGGEQDTP